MQDIVMCRLPLLENYYLGFAIRYQREWHTWQRKNLSIETWQPETACERIKLITFTSCEHKGDVHFEHAIALESMFVYLYIGLI